MRFGGIILAALLILGACTPDPEPKEPPPMSSATPTAVAPTMPAQAKENTPEGAAAFVKHYIEVFNYASNTGDVEELSRLSSPDCEGCQSYIKLYKETYAAGGYLKDSGWVVTDANSKESGTGFSVTLSVSAPETEYRLGSSERVQVGESGVYNLLFDVSPEHIVRTFLRQETPS